jgi:hypothetical protein
LDIQDAMLKGMVETEDELREEWDVSRNPNMKLKD